MAREHVAGLGFGANLGDPAAMIARAVRAIEAKNLGQFRSLSSLWRTPPWGGVEQPDFLNACAILGTNLPPENLLRELKRIESDLGRTPTIHWGPRIIDIDLLFYDDLSMRTEILELPHPRLFERGFVLVPLDEIAPDLRIHGRSVRDALANVERQGIWRLAPLTPETA